MVGESNQNVFFIQIDASSFAEFRDIRARDIESRLYFKLCEVRSVYLNQRYILIAFYNHNLASETFLQVQITRSAN